MPSRSVSALPLPTACTVCALDEYYVQQCSLYQDATCGLCDVSCDTCFGPANTECDACAPGFVPVDWTVYGGAVNETKCAAYDACPYSEWTPWSNCSLVCGGGQTSRNRSLLTIYPCYNESSVLETDVCNTEVCRECYPRACCACCFQLCMLPC